MNIVETKQKMPLCSFLIGLRMLLTSPHGAAAAVVLLLGAAYY